MTSFKQSIIIVLILFYSANVFTQDSRLNLEVNYPIPIDDNFIGRSFKGFIDLGLKYHFSKVKPINLGVSINAGLLKNNKDDRIQPFDVNMTILQPRLFAEFSIKSLTKFHPSVGFGYSFISAKARNFDNFNTQINTSENVNGFNLNLGIALDVSEKLFTQFQYDFIKINLDKGVPKNKYNSNVNILKIGLGYRF
ncbi:hypothetical protein DIS18_07530 [Algibacter marinivivus]|uniref:Outer membrane protein beta-barrel domain-containing protein n=1 Tax=Algibacter marinivivus TaxID=2100723 RepID=A0A2U2X987_9FLAO|nr:outer membrane beta-barrel protein [Algibacter marinivivus]PWH84377.1 hypothetical protein DIS18_07530 [Algibacter marinivivus]